MNAPPQLLAAWLQAMQADDVSPLTHARYKGVGQRFLLWYEQAEGQPFSLPDLTPITLMSYRVHLQQQSAAATVNVHLSALRSWCKWLVNQGHLAENPAHKLKLVKQVQTDAPDSLTNTAIHALLRAAQKGRYGKRDYAIVQMLLQTGMRIGECQALFWQDITLKQRSGLVLIRAGKGNKTRTVPLNSSARAALAEYVAPTLDCEPKLKEVVKKWMPFQKQYANSPFWVSQKGNQLSSPAMWRVVNQLAKDCASRELVPADMRPHDLRHTFAHNYLKQHPGDLIGLARLLGHESLNTTKIYTRLTVSELTKRVEQSPLNAYE
ncbi:MAG: tyrosine-type recombinase/integrase [Chloroflexi bacterium]|nr:tyrosine-type recombinase/integrase [Chloroflexota bacterium]